jgi:proteasome lid subunit RPN8/RPN11
MPPAPLRVITSGQAEKKSRHFPGVPMLQMSKADYDMIRWEAERSYPNECCGILLGNVSGDQRQVTLTITCENMRRDSPLNRYSIDPEKVIAALKLARSRAETIVGFYHSHPDHSPRYSGTDLAEAHWFDCSYVITGVESGCAAATHSFVLVGGEDDKRFAEEKIEIVAYGGMPIAL